MRTAILSFLFLLKTLDGFSQVFGLDTTFNSTGIGVPAFNGAINTEANSVAIQPDGKIVAGGDLFNVNNRKEAFILVRYNEDGSLDKSFGNGGKDSISIYGVIGQNEGDNGDRGGYIALQPDGKILLGGSCTNSPGGLPGFSLSRFNIDGSIDYTFNGYGSTYTAFDSSFYYIGSAIFGSAIYSIGNAITLAPNGKIVMAGSTAPINNINDTAPGFFALARYNSNGTLDNSFGKEGKVITRLINSVSGVRAVALQADGKIVAAGYSTTPSNNLSCFAMIRYNINGSLDSSFGIAGKVTTYFGIVDSSGGPVDYDDAYAIAIQPDGKIILGGYASREYHSLRLSRYNVDGSLDSSFGIGGKVTTILKSSRPFSVAIHSICLQPDGKIIFTCGGGLGFYLGRSNKNGFIDSSFGENGFISLADTQNYLVLSAAMQTDDKIVVGGSSSNNNMVILRFLSALNTGVLNFSSPQNPLLIYPNPINTQATLQYSLSQNESISLTLTDMLGRQVQTFFTNQQREQGEHKEELQLANTLAAGNYILSISNGHSTQGIKVTVVR